MTRAYRGPLGLNDGDGAAAPSSSLSKVKRAAQSRLEDSGLRPTTEERSAAERRSQRSGGGVYEHWLNAMRDPLFGKSSAASVNRARFNSNVRFLMDKEGLDKPTIKAKIDEFARLVSIGQVNVEGKFSWGVFMGMWARLGGSASSEGLAEKIATRTEETDWT